MNDGETIPPEDGIHWPRLMPWLIAAAGMLVYFNSLGTPFLFDDHVAITGNASITPVLPIVLTARWLVDLTFRLNHALGGFNPAGYHVVNVLVHVWAALVLFGLTRRTLRMLPSMEGRGRAPDWIACVTALLWVLHPLQTESVTYVCQRYESMMGLCFLLTLYGFARGATSGGPGFRLRGEASAGQAVRAAARLPWYILSVVACLLGMGTKEVMVTAPLVVWLYDYCFLATSVRETFRRRWAVHAALWLTLVALIVFELRMLAGSAAMGQETVSTAVSPWGYLVIQSEVILYYLRLIVVPHPLCLDYAWAPARGFADALPAFALLAALGLAACVAWAKRRAIGFLGLAFFLVLAPSSSVLPVPDVIAEHRLYLSLAAACALVAWGLFRLVSRLPPRRAACWRNTLAGLLVVLLAGMTMQRNRVYASAETMWRDVLRTQPRNFRQHIALTSVLLDRGDAAGAERECRALLAETERAAAEGSTAAALPSSDPVYHAAVAREQLGRALIMRGQPRAAVGQLQLSWDALPNRKTVAHNLAVAYSMAGHLDAAKDAAGRALDLDPHYARARAFLAYLHVRTGDYGDAAAAYRRALFAAPGLLSARLELAWLLATCPVDDVRDGAEAQRLARAVLDASGGRSVRARDALAAALAESGDWRGALDTAAQAIALAADEGAGDTVESAPGSWGPSADPSRLRERLAAYQEREAWRDD